MIPVTASPPTLQARLVEAEETLRAIRAGEVDALVVRDASPDAQVFTLSSADRPYRMFVENMRDGAATLSESGDRALRQPGPGRARWSPADTMIGAADRALCRRCGPSAPCRRSAACRRHGRARPDLRRLAKRVPVRVSASTLDVGPRSVLCLTFADLTAAECPARPRSIASGRARDRARAHPGRADRAGHPRFSDRPGQPRTADGPHRSGAGRWPRGRKRLIGLIFIDLDGFKEINDTRGHAAGDSVLRQIAQRLQSVVRPMDSVARLGGDEFVVLLPALANLGDAVAVATRIATEIESPARTRPRSSHAHGQHRDLCRGPPCARLRAECRPPASGCRHGDVPRQIAGWRPDRAVRGRSHALDARGPSGDLDRSDPRGPGR